MKPTLQMLIAFGSLMLATGAYALDKPAGDPVLTVTGHIAKTNSPSGAVFDLTMLEKLAGREASMETPWTKGKNRFSGPFLRAVLKAAGASGKKLVIKALNDYSADVPIEDADKLDTILAVRMNGKALSVRDKGPVFLIYPFDKDQALYNEKYFSRSVWQIKEIEVVE